MLRFITLLAVALLSLPLASQTYTFTGCVTDRGGEPLIGAAIQIKHTTVNTVTDVDGCFTLEHTENNAKLVFTYVGFESRNVRASSGEPVSVKLVELSSALEETVVIGRAISRKREMSTADHTAPAPRAMGIAPAHPPTYQDLPAAGQLTAGQLNDFGDWELWTDIAHEDLARFRSVWQLYPDHRYPVQITFASGHPAADVPVVLSTEDGRVIWSGRTDNLGRAELWRGMEDEAAHAQERLRISASFAGRNYELPTAHAIQEGPNFLILDRKCDQPATVDVAFVVDATGSMGDEIRYLSSELLDVMKRSVDSLTGQEVRLASVFYRDTEDAYLTRHTDFSGHEETGEGTASEVSAISFIKKQSAGGGGDTPEAVDAALETALDSLSWSKNASARLLFLVLDAAPHTDGDHVARIQRATARAAKMGVRIIPVVCSGMDKSGEYLLRSMALATNGTYTFLTDDSGIGGSHLEPTTDLYDVEKFNDLLVRLIYQFGRVNECQETATAKRNEFGSPVEDATDWKVYPNPTSGPVTLELPRAEGDVYLLDGLGKVLQHFPVAGERYTAQLGKLPSGVYYLRYRYEEEESTRKVLVERAK